MRRLTTQQWLWIICGVAVLLRFVVFAFPFMNIDENEYRFAAEVIARGGMPYRDFLIYQPPLIYYLYYFTFALFGTTQLWSVHLVVIALVVITCRLLCSLAMALGGSKSAGLWAAGLYAVFTTTFMVQEMLGANIEVVLTCPLVASMLLLVRAQSSTYRRAGLLLMAGVLAGLAAMGKHLALLFLAPSALLLLCQSGTTRSRRLRGLTSFSFGWTVCVGSVLALLALGGVWAEMVNGFRYILLYAKGPPQNDALYLLLKFSSRVGMVGVAGALLWWGALRGVVAGRHHVRDSRIGFLYVWLVMGLLAFLPGGRMYYHYLYFAFPPLCLFGALWLGGHWGGGWLSWSRMTQCLWIGWSLAAVIGFQAHAIGRMSTGSITADNILPMAYALQQRFDPGKTLFVWGYAPQLYTISELAPATRFTTADYLTGRSPKTAGLEYDPAAPNPPTSLEKFLNDFRDDVPVTTEETAANVFPGAWAMLAADFSRRLPDFIVDTVPSNFRRYGRYPMSRYPYLATVIERYYTHVKTLNALDLYERRVDAPTRAPAGVGHSADL